MAPKRKRAEAEAGSASTSRSTRSSARSGTAGVGTSATAEAVMSKPKAKAPTKAAAKEVGPSKVAAGTSKSKKAIDESPEAVTKLEENLQPPLKKGKKQVATSNGKDEKSIENKIIKPASRKNAPSPVIKYTPYTSDRMEQLFASYADEDDPSFIGAEGLEKLCIDANISMEGAQPLLLAWILEASDLGRLTKEEWGKGMNLLQIDTLDKLRLALTEYEALLILDVPAPKPPGPNKKSVVEPYNRNLTYWHCTADVSSAFLKFYNFIFPLAKSPQERNIDIEMAKAFWTALLGQKYSIVNDLIEFMNEKATVKGVNKDLWTMTLDFCQTVKPSLEDYETDGYWPSILDEFVAWKKARQPVAHV